MQKRIKAIFLVIMFLFCSLTVRLFVVQIINGKELQSLALDQWTRDLSLTAQRGSFFDVTGDTLAVSYTTYNVYVRGREVEDVEKTAQILSSTLNIDYEKVLSKVKKKNVSESLIKMQIDVDTAEKIYKKNLSGVYLTENVGRYYVYGDLLSQVLGFTSIDNVGQAGLEAYFNDYLTGQDGYSLVQSDLQGKEIGGSVTSYTAGVSGNDVTLTINSKIQILLEQVLSTAYSEQQAKKVTGIVMNAKTSEILAISTKPSVDLNNLPRDDLQTLFDCSKMSAVTDTYEPGSTFKILTLAMALEAGVVSLEDRFYCPGYRIVDGQKIRCWKTVGHGSQSLMEAFANSCNCCFMDLALRLGVDRFYEYMDKFGLGQKTGITLQGESSGILMNKSSVKNVDLARMGFGHAVAVSPIQLLTAVCGVVGGGELETPTLVKQITDVLGNITYKPKVTKKKIVSSKTMEIINKFMQYAENKKGDFTFVEGYNVGGKTGTAQKYLETGGIAQGKYISSFIGTYPANNPDYVFMILVDEPSAGAYYGSIVGAPYGKMFFEKFFEFFNIQKDDESVVLEEVVMPQLVGVSLADALVELKKLGIECEIDGDGGIVLEQLPPAGAKICKGETILLVT